MNLSIFEKAGIEVVNQGKVKEVFAATGLAWDVIQKPVYSQNERDMNVPSVQHTYTQIPSLVANYRSDNGQFLGMVHPSGYKVVQNCDAFDFIDELPNFTFEKVGMFNGGKKVFVVGKSNERIDIDGSGDLVDFYLTFLHGHDGKSGIRFILCPVRMFCMNQMNLMLETARFKYNIAHTGDINMKLSHIQRAIANSRNYVTGLQAEIESLINTKPTISIMHFADLLIPKDDDDTVVVTRRKEEAKNVIIDLYQNKDDLQNYTGTAFGMISAVSDFISHKDTVRKDASIDNLFIKNIEGNELLFKAREVLKLAA